jgi:glycosyltransferase involved in cell wall biosynthesis
VSVKTELYTDNELLSKLTLAIPVYNEKNYIRQTLDSCINQAGTIWIYDNASDDGTSDICAEYAERFPHVTHIRNEKNINAFNNFRTPLFACTTEYFQWVGSHDILGSDFALPLLKELEKDASTVLAFGRIVHIDEEGKHLKKKSRSYYSSRLQSENPLHRMQTMLSNLRDCFIIHGVFRTKILQEAWSDTACIGFDDALLLKAAALGKFAFKPECTFYARNFPRIRKEVDTQKRRAGLMSLEPESTANSLVAMTALMMETVTSCPQYKKDLTEGFKVFQQIYLRFFEPRKERKARRNKKILLYLAFFTSAALLLTYLISRYFLSAP